MKFRFNATVNLATGLLKKTRIYPQVLFPSASTLYAHNLVQRVDDLH